MVFGKGLDPVPQAIVEKQRAGYVADQAELTARLQREARREELMNSALQGIATQGMADMLGKEKEEREWERRQKELDIREEMAIRQEARAEERGIQTAQRKRLVALEEEMVKLSALTEEEAQAAAVVEILSGVRTQYSSQRTPVSGGGNNVEGQLKEVSQMLKNLDDLDNMNPETARKLDSIKNNLANRAVELQSSAAETARLEAEAGEAAKAVLYKTQTGGAGLSSADRKTLFGPNGYVTRLAKAKAATAKKLMTLRRAQYDALRARVGGPELPEALRRNAALESESVGAAAAQSVAKRNSESINKPSSIPRPGRKRKPKPGRPLDDSSNTSAVSENDARHDAMNLANLDQVSASGRYRPDEFVLADPLPKEKIAENVALDLETNPNVRLATGYGNPTTATSAVEQAVAEDRKETQEGFNARLKNKLLAHNQLGKGLRFVHEVARERQMDMAMKFVMNHEAYKGLVNKYADGAEPPPNLVKDLVGRASQLFAVTSGDDLDTFIENNPHYKQAHDAMKGSGLWAGVVKNRGITIQDVMGYQMVQDMAQYMNTHEISDLSEKQVKTVRGVLGPDGKPSKSIAASQGMNMSEVLNIETLRAMKGVPGWREAFYAVGAGRANYGTRSGRPNRQWGAGGNGFQLRSVVDAASSQDGVIRAYRDMLKRARSENNLIGGELYVSYQNYNTFQRTVHTLMQNSVRENNIWQTLVHIGGR